MTNTKIERGRTDSRSKPESDFRMLAGCLPAVGDDDPLRRLGDMNLYLPNGDYGFVEISHLALRGAILDLARGWPVARRLAETERASGCTC